MADRIDPQPVTLDVRPVELYREEPGRAEALAAANGRDVWLERVNMLAIAAGLLALLVFVAAALLGCGSLPAIGCGSKLAGPAACPGSSTAGWSGGPGLTLPRLGFGFFLCDISRIDCSSDQTGWHE